MSTVSSASLVFVNRIRQQRLQLGWTQSDVATRAGLSVTGYARLERCGRTSLESLLRITEALGLTLVLADSGTATAAPGDPRLLRQRHRGLRHARPVPTPPPTAQPSAEPPAPAPLPPQPAVPAGEPRTSSPRPATPPPAPAEVDAAAVSEIAKQYRDDIRLLARTIVFNRLNNYTAPAVVQNVMRAKRIADSSKPAFVAAVEGELNRLSAENCVALGIDPPHFATWASTWKPELGIVGALE